MHNLFNKRNSVALAICSLCGVVSAQNSTLSPYSMFGLGDVETGTTGMYAGMGDVSLALRDKNYINGQNPASLTALSEQTFLFGVGLYGEYRQMEQKATQQSAFMGNLKNINFGFRVCPAFYLSLGITPLSTVGYAMQTTEPIEGSTSSMYTSYSGSGGLNKVYAGTAVSIGKKLSLGINWAYIYGTINQTESQGNSTIDKESFGQAFYPEFGLQYKESWGSNGYLTLGTTYSYQQKIKLKNSLTVTTTSEETISQLSTEQYLPQQFGVGAAVRANKILLALDYYNRDYTSMKKEISTVSYQNQHQLSLGVDLMTEKRNKTTHWMLGVSAANNYLKIKDQTGYRFSISTGVAIPTQTIGMLGVALKYERQFYRNKAGINENRISLNFNIQLGELSLIRKLQ